MKKIFLNALTISSFVIVPFAIISCANEVKEEVASDEDIVSGLKAVKFEMNYDQDKINLRLSMDKESIEFNDFKKLLEKKSFLTNYGTNLENLVLPIFVGDASPSAYFGYQKNGNYATSFDINFDRFKTRWNIHSQIFHELPFDATQQNNYSFLFNTLNSHNNYNVTLSVPKWYLQLLAQQENYIREKRKGIVKYFLKIRNVYPDDDVFNNDAKDWSIPKKEIDQNDFTNRAIPFWIVEVSYNVNEDTFEVREADSKEEFDVAWWVGSEGLDSKKS